MQGLQPLGPKGESPKWRRGKKSKLGVTIDNLHKGLKRGKGYVPLTAAAIRLVACYECREFGNIGLLGRSAIKCGASILRVLHPHTAMDYIPGRVNRPQDWLLEGREVLIAREFN